MPNTMPEGVTPPPFTPEPQASQTVGSKSFLVAVSTILGIIIGTGVVFGAFGRAFYVERTEFTAKNLQDTQDRVTVSEGLKGIGTRFDRQESALFRMETSIEKVTTDLQALKVEVARRLR